MRRSNERTVRRERTQPTLVKTAEGLVLTVIPLVAVSQCWSISIHVVEIKGE
jgi:hypothetical protein